MKKRTIEGHVAVSCAKTVDIDAICVIKCREILTYYSSVTGSVTYSVTDSVMRALNGKYREGLLSAPQPEVLRPRRLNAYVGQWLCLLMRL